MKLSALRLTVISLFAFSTCANADEGYKFSLGTGLPYIINAEVSYQPEGSDIHWYANAKGSLDYGFAIGFENPVSDDKKHALGLFIGAIGIRDNEEVCREEQNVSDSFACIFVEIFDEETTNGLGASYSYSLNGLGDRGWKLRLEAGYGEGRDSGESRADAGLILTYQF